MVERLAMVRLAIVKLAIARLATVSEIRDYEGIPDYHMPFVNRTNSWLVPLLLVNRRCYSCSKGTSGECYAICDWHTLFMWPFVNGIIHGRARTDSLVVKAVILQPEGSLLSASMKRIDHRFQSRQNCTCLSGKKFQTL
jgi:hypothetical protein